MGCRFTCIRESLSAINILYVMVSVLMIGIAAWGEWLGLLSSFQVVGGVIGVGVFLFLVALVGLVGAVKHHQVLLFFYMIILFLVFIVQFSVSSACLAITKEQQDCLLEMGWNNSDSAQQDVEKTLNCCGYRHVDPNSTCSAVRQDLRFLRRIFGSDLSFRSLRFAGLFPEPVLSVLCRDHPGPRRRGPPLRWRDRALLQLYSDSGSLAHLSIQEPEGPSSQPKCFPVRRTVFTSGSFQNSPVCFCYVAAAMIWVVRRFKSKCHLLAALVAAEFLCPEVCRPCLTPSFPPVSVIHVSGCAFCS